MICRVCHKDKSKTQMRRTSKGRTLLHCIDCKGLYRCIHCDEVKLSDKFKTNSQKNTKSMAFEDGERLRIAVCYNCDFKLNKARYQRYDRKQAKTESIFNIIQLRLSKWRTQTVLNVNEELVDKEYLINLWDKQNGICPFTGDALLLTRGKTSHTTLSLDKLDPKKGYIKGNVVWTTFLTNTTKQNRNINEFIDFCRKVVNYHDNSSINLTMLSP